MNREPYYSQDQFSAQFDREEYIRWQKQQLFAKQQREDYENYMRKKQQYIQNMYYDKNGMNTPIKITEDKDYKSQRKTLDNANDKLITNLTKENQYTNYQNQYIHNLNDNIIIKPYNEQNNQNYQIQNQQIKNNEEQYPKVNYHLQNQIQNENQIPFQNQYDYKQYENPQILNYQNLPYENQHIPPEYIQQYEQNQNQESQIEIPYQNNPEQKYYEYLQNNQNNINQNIQNDPNLKYSNLQAIGNFPAPKIFPETYIPNSEIIDKYTTEMKNEKIKRQNLIDQMQLPLYQYGKYLKPVIDPLNNNNPNLKPGELPFDRRLEERQEYLENKMKNNSTYSNLTHQMTNDISLKSIPLRPISNSDKEKFYQMQIKEEKMRRYKQSLDEQIKNKPITAYSKENNDAKREIPPDPFSGRSNGYFKNFPVNK